jgi:Tol biopolymer transport system component
MIALALLVIALIVAVAAAYVGSHRVPSPFGLAGNGLVAFSQGGDIYVNDPASGQSRILVGGDSQDSGAIFSLDGTRLAFVRKSPSGPGLMLVVGNADGSNLKVVTPKPFEDLEFTAFSPDGRSIAVGYVTDRAKRVAIVPIDGSAWTPIPVPAADFPSWRPPDGKEILVRGMGADYKTDLFLVRADGSDVRPLHIPNLGFGGADWDLAGPTWSPDGTRIAYNSVDKLGTDGSHFRVHVVLADGSGDIALPGPRGATEHEGWTNWSPDGRSLVVQRWQGEPPMTTMGLIPADGHDGGMDIGPVLANNDDAFHVSWAPDGTQILAFSDASQTLVAIDRSTGAMTTPTWTTHELPDWQRVAP